MDLKNQFLDKLIMGLIFIEIEHICMKFSRLIIAWLNERFVTIRFVEFELRRSD